MHEGECGLNVVWKRHARRTVCPPLGGLLLGIAAVFEAYPLAVGDDAAPVFDAQRGRFARFVVTGVAHAGLTTEIPMTFRRRAGKAVIVLPKGERALHS